MSLLASFFIKPSKVDVISIIAVAGVLDRSRVIAWNQANNCVALCMHAYYTFFTGVRMISGKEKSQFVSSLRITFLSCIRSSFFVIQPYLDVCMLTLQCIQSCTLLYWWRRSQIQATWTWAFVGEAFTTTPSSPVQDFESKIWVNVCPKYLARILRLYSSWHWWVWIS